MSQANYFAALAESRELYEIEKAEFIKKYPNEEPVLFEDWLEEL